MKRLVEPRDSGECVATCDANGLLVTKEEAESLVEAGAVDRRGDHARPTRQLQKRRRSYVSRDLRA